MDHATLSIASVGLSSLSSGASALGKSSADSYQAAQLDRAAQYGELKATQTSAQLTRNMGMTLANMDAVRAASHDSSASPTGAAVRGQVEDQLTTQKNIQVGSIDAQVQQDEAGAAYLRNASSMALLTGGVGMLSPLLGKQGIAGLPQLSGSPS